ncbi:hypothetical protein [Treponema phagedenis]|uniref:hypothetical protein n=1 Tax=Treponema phagedenis TaxID=162 RepID=UPI003D2988B3
MKKSTIFAYIFYTYENADGKKSHPVLSICKALGVSERGYYGYFKKREKEGKTYKNFVVKSYNKIEKKEENEEE